MTERRGPLGILGEKLQAAFAARFSSIPVADAGNAIEIVFGIDFGTTATKCVIRFPFEAGSPAFLVPAPAGAQAEGNRGLWATCFCRDTSGRCSLSGPGQRVAGIKENLLDGKPNAAHDAATYLALVVRTARDWLVADRRAQLTGRPQNWSYNLGFPAASLDNNHLRALYVSAASAAIAATTVGSAALDAGIMDAFMRKAPTDPEVVRTQHEITLQPEIAGAVTALREAHRLPDGLYAAVDVGGSTVDAATFRLHADAEGTPHCGILSAKVERLGVLIPAARDRNGVDRIAEIPKSVLWHTRNYRDFNAEEWSTRPLPLMFIGGGVESIPHRRAVESLPYWFRHSWLKSRQATMNLVIAPSANDLILPTETPPIWHRFAVAQGLSMPATDIVQVTPQSCIPDEPIKMRSSSDDIYVSKEQT